MLADRVRMGSSGGDIDTMKDYLLATDDDFYGDEDGQFAYVVWEENKVIIPHVIKGVPVTSYTNMFAMTIVIGVASYNKNVTDMSHMFEMSFATTLDLRNLDTSNVTDMSHMFQESYATSINLSNFDTSNVTNMSDMFHNSQATSLDLSSFDTSNVTAMNYMFHNSQATIGYARTQTDADRFNASSGKPSGLIFVVK